jgi:predicted small secreted protein
MKRPTEIRKTAAAAFLTLFTLAAAAGALSACNTMAGMGQDLNAAGSAITGSAEKTKERL